MAVHERLLKTVPSYKKNILEIDRFTKEYVARTARFGLRSGVVIIPVVVHVVYNTAAQNISDAQIQSQIPILNEDYRMLNADASSVPTDFQPVAADARIQFQLAVRDPNCNPTTGITRTSTSVTSFTDNDAVKFNSQGGHDAWPRDRYLNIWVCQLVPWLGYAQFPGGPAATDGVVIRHSAFGNTGTATAPFNRGRTATHEIGHWLSLRHIWGDATCGDDGVADTPVHNGPNYGCPAQPHYSTCTGTPREMTMNYMDYTDDPCMYMFTAGQCSKMDACLYGPRSAIVASDALISPPAPPTADLWSQDTPEDIGNEPNTLSPSMWVSDDIWIRRQNDGVTYQEHQNPEYRPTGSPPNYVYVRIRNRGCMQAASANVKLYWAKASTALAWPAPWDGSVTSPAMMGGLIGTKPTGAVPGGGSVILEFPWNPPNPDDYTSFGADKSHFCLLSRIETSSSSPFGMTFPEGPDLYANVRNNNNIIWKNITVVGPGEAKMAWVTVGNFTKEAALIKLVLTSPTKKVEYKPKTIFEWGTVEIDLGKELFTLWKKGNSAGEGIERSERYKIKVSSPKAWIGNIKLEPKKLITISAQFVPFKERAEGYNVFFFDITQYIRTRMLRVERVTGGLRCAVKTTPIKRSDPSK